MSKTPAVTSSRRLLEPTSSSGKGGPWISLALRNRGSQARARRADEPRATAATLGGRRNARDLRARAPRPGLRVARGVEPDMPDPEFLKPPNSTSVSAGTGISFVTPVYSQCIKALAERDYKELSRMEWLRALACWLSLVEGSQFQSDVGGRVWKALATTLREEACGLRSPKAVLKRGLPAAAAERGLRGCLGYREGASCGSRWRTPSTRHASSSSEWRTHFFWLTPWWGHVVQHTTPYYVSLHACMHGGKQGKITTIATSIEAFLG